MEGRTEGNEKERESAGRNQEVSQFLEKWNEFLSMKKREKEGCEIALWLQIRQRELDRTPSFIGAIDFYDWAHFRWDQSIVPYLMGGIDHVR